MLIQAETAAEVYEIYGIKHTTLYAKTLEQYKKAKRDLKRAEKEYNEATIHNIAVSQAGYSDINTRISEKQARLSELDDALIKGINLSREDIFEMNTEYVRLQTELTDLNKQRVSYTALHQEIYNYSQIQSLTSDVVRLEVEVQRLASSGAIGDVKGVYHPISAKYKVGLAFTESQPFIHLTAKSKTPVMAQFNGKVTEAGYKKSLGEYVTIDHGEGIITKYSNLQNRYVKEGDEVKQYDCIGTVSKKGYITYSIYLQDKPVDPNILLGGNAQ